MVTVVGTPMRTLRQIAFTTFALNVVQPDRVLTFSVVGMVPHNGVVAPAHNYFEINFDSWNMDAFNSSSPIEKYIKKLLESRWIMEASFTMPMRKKFRLKGGINIIIIIMFKYIYLLFPHIYVYFKGAFLSLWWFYFSILKSGGYWRIKSKLTTDNFGVIFVETIVANSAPASIDKHLQSALCIGNTTDQTNIKFLKIKIIFKEWRLDSIKLR